MNKEQLYDELIKRFSREGQIIVAIEEMSELTKELTKNLRGIGNEEHLAEEVADVEIMLEQIVRMMEVREEVDAIKEFKLQRTMARLEK